MALGFILEFDLEVIRQTLFLPPPPPPQKKGLGSKLSKSIEI